MRSLILILAAACGHVDALPDAAPTPGSDAPPPPDVSSPGDIYDPSEAASSCDGTGLCGAGEYCCGSLTIPAGEFSRAFDAAGDPISGTNTARAQVSEFRLDRFEVTVGRFRAFVAAGGGTQQHPPPAGYGPHERIPGTGWNAAWDALLQPTTSALVAQIGTDCPEPQHATWTDRPGANELLPINCITWYEANAFCLWDGGRLPTSAEASYAATGGSEQRAYPWSSPPESVGIDTAHAVYGCLGAGDEQSCVLADIAPVGSRPAGTSRWGQVDLAGNVAEWVFDAPGDYPASCTDCITLDGGGPGNPREVHGGSWADNRGQLRPSFRFAPPAALRTVLIGVRCAVRAGS